MWHIGGHWMKHIILTNTFEEAPYKSMSFNGAKKDVPFREPKIHAVKLKVLLDDESYA
jgi:hypothetical protein